jgi:2,4-dienoyl-CoA reductase-like NADH-dependent reductase (Old Yellow Enzyme family)/NADPH-dependent 2,4-dienoyl-CoA reductase/sulfur reductase-like enzyme
LTRFPNLFSPMKLGPYTLRNRIQSAPMGYYGTPEGYLTNEGAAYYELRAKGGAAIVTIGESMVDSSGTSHGRVTPLDDPGILPSLIDTTDGIKRHGAVASIELLHAGTRSRTDRPDGAVYGPSVGTSFYGKPIIEMDDAEIDRIVNAFGDAAAMSKRGGCQMVMVHGGHGWLLSQFLSPLHNQRTDQFGGSIENRTRFVSMIVDDIKKKCGPNFPVEMRLSGDEFTEGGMKLPEVVEVAKILDDNVDMFNVSATTFNDTTAGLRMFPSMFLPRGANVYLAEEIKKAVKSPVNTVGALNYPANMEDILARGGADMVTLGRALLADPFLPEKARMGCEDDITPCIRCNYCISQSFTPYVKHPTFITRCVVNPVIGREYETKFTQPSASRKKVLIAGGGPGGMQAAITAADRGHEVVLCEKADRLGGALLYTEGEYFKEDIGKLVKVLARRVKGRPIELRMGTEVTPELVNEVSPDVLIASVGAEPSVPPIPGVEKAVVAASLYDEDAIGDRVVVIGGGMVGCEKALHLAHLGRDVTVLEILDKAAPEATYLHWLALTKELEKNVALELSTKCTRIADEGVYAVKGGDEVFYPADSVLLATGVKPRAGLVESLRDCAPVFSVIGDCYQPGTVLEAIHYGYFTALNI